MKLYDKAWDRDRLRRSVGNMDQIAGIRLVQLDEGNERPARAALFHTGTGLDFTVMLDRGMDISSASYQGMALGWRSTTGDVAPQYFEPEGIRWLRSYFGGLVTTCGLTNVGSPAPESALTGQGLHGRIGHAPARNIQVVQEWQGDDYVLSVTGTLRETVVFGENLTLKRTVSTKLGETRFWITDELTNEGFKNTPYMLLYHCNLGWPLLDEGSRILSPSRHVAPRDDEGRKGQEHWALMDAPTHGYKEKVYYHEMVPDSEGNVTVALVNKGLAEGTGLGLYIKYTHKTLPRFVQWKQMGEQDYVLGFEPCNCGVRGRREDEEQGLLHTIAPGETRVMGLEFGALTAQAEADAIARQHEDITPKIVDSYQEFVKKP